MDCESLVRQPHKIPRFLQYFEKSMDMAEVQTHLKLADDEPPEYVITASVLIYLQEVLCAFRLEEFDCIFPERQCRPRNPVTHEVLYDEKLLERKMDEVKGSLVSIQRSVEEAQEEQVYRPIAQQRLRHSEPRDDGVIEQRSLCRDPETPALRGTRSPP